MCKIAIITGITDETAAQAWELSKKLADKMSTYTEKDGFGYAAIDANGDMFGERWLNNNEAFVVDKALTEEEVKILGKYKGMLSKEVTYDKFGSVNPTGLRSITLHSRAATSGKEFCNTHPFVDGFTSLIHNGIIRNVQDFNLKLSSCDSEAILQAYQTYDVANNPEHIQDMIDSLNGYYACAVFSRTDDDTVILDIFRDSQASLYAIYVVELKTIVIGTKEEQLKEAIEAADLTVGESFKVASGLLLRLNAITGDVILAKQFDPYSKMREIKEKKKFERTIPQIGKTTEVTIEPNDAHDVMKTLEALGDWECLEGTHTWKRLRG